MREDLRADTRRRIHTVIRWFPRRRGRRPPPGTAIGAARSRSRASSSGGRGCGAPTAARARGPSCASAGGSRGCPRRLWVWPSARGSPGPARRLRGLREPRGSERAKLPKAGLVAFSAFLGAAMQFRGQTLHGVIRRIKVLRVIAQPLKPPTRARRELSLLPFCGWMCGGVAATLMTATFPTPPATSRKAKRRRAKPRYPRADATAGRTTIPYLLTPTLSPPPVRSPGAPPSPPSPACPR